VPAVNIVCPSEHTLQKKNIQNQKNPTYTQKSPAYNQRVPAVCIYSSMHWPKIHSKRSVYTIKRALHTLKWARYTLEEIHSKRYTRRDTREEGKQTSPAVYNVYVHPCLDATGWRRLIGCLELQVNCHNWATNYRALVREKTYEDRASCDATPPCTYTPQALYNLQRALHTLKRALRCILVCAFIYYPKSAVEA